MPIAGLNWIDVAMAVVIALSVILGLVRGAVWEVLSLLGWAVAWFAAQWGGAIVAVSLPIGTPGSWLNHAAGYTVAFIGALLAWRLVTWVLERLIKASPLKTIDRLLGGVFGLCRGVLIVLAASMLVVLTPAAKAPEWRQSHGGRLSSAALSMLAPLFPGGWTPRTNVLPMEF